MLCAPDGGVLDDLVIYRQGPDRFLVVANAANTAVVLGGTAGAVAQRAGAASSTRPDGTGLIAIQGPNAPRVLATVTDLDRRAGMRLLRGRLRDGRRLARRGSRGPGTRARTASRSTARRKTPSTSGRRCRGGGAGGAGGAGTRGRPPACRARRPRYAPPGGRDAAVRQRTRPGRDTV